MERYVRQTWKAHGRPISRFAIDVHLVARALWIWRRQLVADLPHHICKLIRGGAINARVCDESAKVGAPLVVREPEDAISVVSRLIVLGKILRLWEASRPCGWENSVSRGFNIWVAGEVVDDFLCRAPNIWNLSPR